MTGEPLPEFTESAKVISEFIGSAILVMVAISPIILFHSVMGMTIGLAVLADAVAVGFVLFVLIEMFGPVGGAHFNPAVSVAMLAAKKINARTAVLYSIAQITGGMVGMLTSHLMFYHEIQKIAEVSEVTRNGGAYFAEFVGTFVLVLAILVLVTIRSKKLPLAIGLLVGGMLMATSSTMFANPQVTIARVFTYSAAGVRPTDALVFIVVEITGALVAVVVWKYALKEKCTFCATGKNYKLR